MSYTHFTGVDTQELAIDGTPVTANPLGIEGVTCSVEEVNILDGATLTTDELNLLDGAPASVSIAAAADGANKTKVTIKVLDYDAKAIEEVFCLMLWLSDDAAGSGLTGTTASGDVKAGSVGAVLSTLTAKKHLIVATNDKGIFELSVEDASKTAFVVSVALPLSAKVAVTALKTADYGSGEG